MKGAVSMYVRDGQEITAAWPKKRKKNLPSKTKDQMEWFRQAQLAGKYMAPQIMFNIMEAVKGTPLLPRDIVTMMLSGRLAAFAMEGGPVYYPRVAMNDVSTSLDTITQTVGWMLVRGPTGWEGQPVPSIPPGGGGGIADWLNTPPNSVSYGDASATMGTWIVPDADITVYAITIYQLVRAGAIYRGVIYEVDAATGNMIAPIAESNTFTQSYQTEGRRAYALTNPVVLQAGTAYFIGVRREDGTGFDNMGPQFFSGNSAFASAPITIGGVMAFQWIATPPAGTAPSARNVGKVVWTVGVVHAL